jgi:hypothetical protein
MLPVLRSFRSAPRGLRLADARLWYDPHLPEAIEASPSMAAFFVKYLGNRPARPWDQDCLSQDYP